MTSNQHFNDLKNAFEKDGFAVVDMAKDARFKAIPRKYLAAEGYILLNDGSGDKIGVLAEHKTIKSVTGCPKRTYYIEGNNRQMGFMMGLMAEPEIYLMAYDYVDDVVFDFIGLDLPDWLVKILGSLIAKILYPGSEKIFENFVPAQYKDELSGMIDACLEINPKIRKDNFTQRLKVLNVGIDCILSHFYTGKLSAKKTFEIPPFLLRIPVMCNAYSISGAPVKNNGHYFGRDFMFPTAGVFQDTACIIIYKPDGGDLPLVSQAAPGFIGSFAAMNSKGVAIGVDMSPSAFCDVENPGLNSLMLNRCSLHAAGDAVSLKKYMLNTQRGVSWLYPTADGKSGTGCIFEAGVKQQDFPYLDFVNNFPLTDYPKSILPDKEQIDQTRKSYPKAPGPEMGLIARSSDYDGNFTLAFNEQYNEKLWDKYPLWWLNLTLKAAAVSLEEIEKAGKLDVEKILAHITGIFHGGDGAVGKLNREAWLDEFSRLWERLHNFVDLEGMIDKENLDISSHEETANMLNEWARNEEFEEIHKFIKKALGTYLKLAVPADDLEKVMDLKEILLENVRPFCRKVVYDPAWFGERAYIDKAVDNADGFQLEHNCPGPYYFAPQREKRDNVVLVSNHCITPEMRLTAMTIWLNFLEAKQVDDIQWRYDELNNEILAAIDKTENPKNPQKIDETIAWHLINFLSPEPGYNFPHYYNKNPQIPWQNVLVHGSISLFDLVNKICTSKFGYYGDQPITITLPNYLK